MIDRTNAISSQVTMTLDECVKEVLVVLTGQDLVYDSSFDRFRVITRHLNRALRNNSLEQEWSYYSERLRLGEVQGGETSFVVNADWRFRVKGDDAVRFLNGDGVPVYWAYFLPRNALHKYASRAGMWCSVTRNEVLFSRPLPEGWAGAAVELNVMREPVVFVLPHDPITPLSQEVLDQPLDFPYPDLITARAAWLYAQTDPLMQPRVQTLEDQYKSLMYQLIERDDTFTDSPYQNEILVPVQNGIHSEGTYRPWPVSNRR